MRQTQMFSSEESDVRVLTCRCGCGETFAQRRVGRVRYYVNDVHKRRALAKLNAAKSMMVSEAITELLVYRSFGVAGMKHEWVSDEVVQFIDWLYEMDSAHRDFVINAIGEIQANTVKEAVSR